MIRSAEFTNSFCSNPGSRFHTLYKATVIKTGEVVLKENGVEDLWEKINAEADGCDMRHILNQIAMGDYSALDNQTEYIDMTQFPTDRRGLLDLFINVENTFNTLPPEVRQKFNNDYKQWYMSGDTEEWRDKMSPVIKTEEVKEEVQDAVSES